MSVKDKRSGHSGRWITIVLASLASGTQRSSRRNEQGTAWVPIGRTSSTCTRDVHVKQGAAFGTEGVIITFRHERVDVGVGNPYQEEPPDPAASEELDRAAQGLRRRQRVVTNRERQQQRVTALRPRPGLMLRANRSANMSISSLANKVGHNRSGSGYAWGCGRAHARRKRRQWVGSLWRHRGSEIMR